MTIDKALDLASRAALWALTLPLRLVAWTTLTILGGFRDAVVGLMVVGSWTLDQAPYVIVLGLIALYGPDIWGGRATPFVLAGTVLWMVMVEIGRSYQKRSKRK